MKIYGIALAVIILIPSCQSNSQHISKSAWHSEKIVKIYEYYPNKLNENLLYIGTTHYTKAGGEDKIFDTTYIDTIKITRIHEDSISFNFNELNYKQFDKHFSDEVFTTTHLYDKYCINTNNFYEYKSDSIEIYNNVKLHFLNTDSLIVTDFFYTIQRNVRENHTFKGRKLQ